MGDLESQSGPRDDETVPTESRVTQAIEVRECPVVWRRITFIVTAGPDAGQHFKSHAERMTLGNDPAADVVLHDPSISRFHVEITVSDGRVTVRDLGSRNGTVLDGVSVTHGFAKNGSMLAIGRTEVRIDLTPDYVSLPVSTKERFGTMVGRSQALRIAFYSLERAAESMATVLLEGETGTGKEGAAESIHTESARRAGPFIVVDCSAIPPELLESELFGHEKGAFTGAVSAREGAFAAAHGGTIFLDEIGELTPALQPKLLRVLERREIKPVGSNHHRRVDVRVIAATNRDLHQEVNAKRFRSDLFYRLAVLRVRLPALRERADDLPLLVDALLDQIGAVDPAETTRLRSAAFVQHLARHTWPGNVRELRNYLERCSAMHDTAPFGEATGSDSAQMPMVDARLPLKAARDVWLSHLERQYLQELLRLHNNNVTAAARAAELNRTYFHTLLSRHGLR